MNPHPFIPDPDVPADPWTRRRVCAECHLLGEVNQ